MKFETIQNQMVLGGFATFWGGVFRKAVHLGPSGCVNDLFGRPSTL